MTRIFHWAKPLPHRGWPHRAKMGPDRRSRDYRPRLEPLEDRRLLALVTVDTLDDTVDFNDGVTSLREALFATNLVGGADTIEFAAALTSGGPATLTLTQGELPITDALAINGPGADLLTIDASGNDPTPDSTLDDGLFNDGDGSRVFNIDDGNSGNLLDVAVSGLTLTGGDALGNGGAIRSLENLSVTGSTVTGNLARGNGGGIYVYDGNLNVTGSTISNNAVGINGGGGGIFSNRQFGRVNNVTVTDSTIRGNSEAGGIFSVGDLTVTGSTIEGNSTDGSGGGIGTSHGNVTITDSTISGNSAGHGGGGISSRYGQVTVTNSTVSGNFAEGGASESGGGGINNYHGDLVVTRSTISGNMAKLNGGGIYSRSGDMSIVDSTIRENSSDHAARRYGDQGGGGIFDRFGNVTVTGSSIILNSSVLSDGGGIGSPNGQVTVTDSTIRYNSAAGDGGGIRGGTVTIVGSTIRSNSANNGGGIWGGRLTVTDSTISHNRATEDGGGIFGRFGGVTMIGSTLSENEAREGSGGGLYLFRSASAIRHSTITRNAARNGGGGGAFIFGGSLALDHTILAANTATFGIGPDLTGLIGSVFDVRFSLIGDNRNSGLAEAPVGTPDANGNLVGGATGRAIDPRLGPLSNNGGPTTTHAPLLGSPAIDAGDPAAVAGVGGVPQFDQRGAPFRRVFGSRIDIGAVEQQSLNWVVDTLADESDGNYGPGDLSLREAIDLTRGTFGPATITFAPALTAGGPATIHLTRGELAIRNAVNIVGPGPNLLTIDASGNDPTPDEDNGDGSRIFNVNDGKFAAQIDVSISGLSLTGGDVSGEGGAILSFENTTVTRCTISGNSAGTDGGGIARFGTGTPTVGSLTVVSSTISGNSAGSDGGGIFSFNVGNTTVTLSTISGNSARFHGGGIVSDFFGNLTVSGSTISGNSAANGGGIWADLSTVEVNHSIVAGNNTREDAAPNDATVPMSLAFSLLGVDTGATITDNGGNLIGTAGSPLDPLLGPLGDNGGPTMTHTLLPGSPAIDAGDPAAVAGVGGVPQFDQRGAPFGRVVNGDAIPGARIDIGAFEFEPPSRLSPGDYNDDGRVDSADYVVWRKALSASVIPHSGADGSGNGVIDQTDCAVWKAHFGQTLSPPGAGSTATAVQAPAEPVAQLAIESSEHAALPRDSAAAAVAVSTTPHDPQARVAANSLGSRSARRAVPPLADAVFTTFGQRTAARSTRAVVRMAMQNAAIDLAIADPLLLLPLRRHEQTSDERSAQPARDPSQDSEMRPEWTGVLEYSITNQL